jgi:GTP-binding protein
LFNRIAGNRIAIVSDTPGTTRDRVSVDAEWFGRRFMLIDTAGIEDKPTAEVQLWDEVRAQTELAIAEADAVVWLVDSADGVTASDYDAAELIRRADKPYALAANKTDNTTRMAELYTFAPLGMGEAIPISAYHDIGIAELMDTILQKVEDRFDDDTPSDVIKVAIAGRPNVGKSAIFNALTGEERSIVSPLPGTTRDTVDATYLYQDINLMFLDTAGLRRRGKMEKGIEKFSAIRTIGAIEQSDVTIIVLDATEFVTAQDTHIGGFARDAYKAGVVCINKWDLSREADTTFDQAVAEIRDRFKFIPEAPILFTSAINGRGIRSIPEAVRQTFSQFTKRVDESELSRTLYSALGDRPLPTKGRRRVRISGIEQVAVRPPTFVITCKNPEYLHFSYKRYLENKLRNAFGFKGSPIKMLYRGGN